MLTKKFWSHVKSSKNSSRIPEVMSYEGLTANEPLAKANMFNQYFYKQFSEPSCYETNIEFDNDITFDIDFSAPRVKLLLDNLDINKAQGPDAISGAVLKNCSETLAYPLSILFNLSYNTGYIPQEWKLANVVPVHKKDDKNKVINYRPISLTSLVMKVFERILYDELLTRTIDKIDKRQHGFLRNRSCNSNLLLFTESIARSLHEKIGTDVIYFDFAKAFDTVSYDLILNKLKTQYNIDGTLLKFFTEYLRNRKQRVILDNVISESVVVLSGVPQGSILGPLLFVLFINDIYENINKDSNSALFADDTKIWRDINSELSKITRCFLLCRYSVKNFKSVPLMVHFWYTFSTTQIFGKKFQKCTINGTLLKFFTEYLRSRKQHVILDNVISESVDVLSGVPQGSILGPLLFVLFINDIYANIDNDSNIALFADDTKIWRDINSESDCETLQNDINTLSILVKK